MLICKCLWVGVVSAVYGDILSVNLILEATVGNGGWRNRRDNYCDRWMVYSQSTGRRQKEVQWDIHSVYESGPRTGTVYLTIEQTWKFRCQVLRPYLQAHSENWINVSSHCYYSILLELVVGLGCCEILLVLIKEYQYFKEFVHQKWSLVIQGNELSFYLPSCRCY